MARSSRGHRPDSSWAVAHKPRPLPRIVRLGRPANDNHRRPERDFRAELRGRNEVPLTLSAARGSLSLMVNDTDTSVHFVLEYSGLLTAVAAGTPQNTA